MTCMVEKQRKTMDKPRRTIVGMVIGDPEGYTPKRASDYLWTGMQVHMPADQIADHRAGECGCNQETA